MCFFTMSVAVADTHIFARGSNGSQYLVYSMAFTAAGELAMVLPLPVPRNSPEDAVRFINLERYADFFADMRLGIPLTRSVDAVSLGAPPLQVHDVGCFEASFVPKIADFDRLDERFRITDEVWAQLPIYRDYGFAVFKLKGKSTRQNVHPMAFEFPRRNPELLYFPTVHIHDRQLYSVADFHHTLYCQAGAEFSNYLDDWRRSDDIASTFVDIDRAQGIVDPNLHCWYLPLLGRRENADTFVGKNGGIPAAV